MKLSSKKFGNFIFFSYLCNMAKESVLKEAIKKLQYNTMVLKERRTKCSTKKEINEIDKQIAQNDSMILDYEYRIKNNLG